MTRPASRSIYCTVTPRQLGLRVAPPDPHGSRLDIALPSCEFYPVAIDTSRRTVGFARIDRDTYRDAGFLVPRAAELGARLYSYNLDDLLLYDRIDPIKGVATHYVLITAFCCSTLLARYFDLLAGCLVLREPGLLGQLAILRNRPAGRTGAADWGREWGSWAGLGLALLSRSFEGCQTAVIKAADVCNNMADVLLARDARSKLILLSVPLRTFIISALKSPSRRDWMRARARFWLRESQTQPAIPAVDLDRLDDARKSAYLWTATQRLWDGPRSGAGPERLMELDGESVSNAPRSTMGSLLSFLGIAATTEELDHIASDSMGKRHAKEPNRSYGAGDRARDLEEWERRFGREADAAVQWAGELR